VIPDRAEIIRSLTGAIRLARLDAGGMALFNVTLAGFWRSFFAAVLVAPVYLVLIALNPSPGDQAIAFEIKAVREVVFYAAGWAIFPVIMIPIARFLDLGPRYVGYIIAYNWAQVPMILLWLPIEVAGAIGVLPEALLSILSLAATLAIVGYLYVITRIALGTPMMTAIAIVVIEFLSGVVLFGLKQALIA